MRLKTNILLAIASQPTLVDRWASAFMTAFVPAYRCGAVADLHRVPSCDAPTWERTSFRPLYPVVLDCQHHQGLIFQEMFTKGFTKVLRLTALFCIDRNPKHSKLDIVQLVAGKAHLSLPANREYRCNSETAPPL